MLEVYKHFSIHIRIQAAFIGQGYNYPRLPCVLHVPHIHMNTDVCASWTSDAHVKYSGAVAVTVPVVGLPPARKPPPMGACEPWEHVNHGNVWTMGACEPWEHVNHGSMWTMGACEPWEQVNHGNVWTMEHVNHGNVWTNVHSDMSDVTAANCLVWCHSGYLMQNAHIPACDSQLHVQLVWLFSSSCITRISPRPTRSAFHLTAAGGTGDKYTHSLVICWETMLSHIPSEPQHATPLVTMVTMYRDTIQSDAYNYYIELWSTMVLCWVYNSN